MEVNKVGDIARLAGISVRTLHHYDEIGLLRPSERLPNGYRSYSDSDLSQLQQILAYRELGLRLEQISDILDEPGSRGMVLSEARVRVLEQIGRLERIAESLDTAIEADMKGHHMSPQDKPAAYGGFDPEEFAQETEQRWGDTGVFAESTRRTNSYSAEDWKRFKAEEAEVYLALMGLMRRDVPAESEQAAILVDAHRRLITKWFYDCTPDIHQGLGQMYTSDERFRTNINKSGEGLAEYLSTAMAARYATPPSQ